MKKMVVCTFISLLAMLYALPASASQDQYPGDSSIYGSTQTVLDPNVLIVIDTSGSMSDTVTGANYNSATHYAVANKCGTSMLDPCIETEVYQVITNTGDAPVYSDLFPIGSVTNSVCPSSKSGNAYKPQYNLQGTAGNWTGRSLTLTGGCGSSGTSTYYYGNYINWLFFPGGGLVKKIEVVKNVVDQLIKTTTGVRFGVMTYNYDAGKAGFGSQFIADIPSGCTSGTYTGTVQEMDVVSSYQCIVPPSTTAAATNLSNRTALRRLVRNITNYYVDSNNQGSTPLAESLYETGQYYLGAAPAFGATKGVSGGTYTSPATPSCRKNYVVFLTDGMSTSDSWSSSSTTGVSGLDPGPLGSFCQGAGVTHYGDCDGDGQEPGISTSTSTSHGVTTTKRTYDYSHSFDDVAKYIYDGPKNVSTFTIGFGLSSSDQDAINLLNSATNSSHGHGHPYLATDQASLTLAFTSIVANILSANTSYVAPVVPVSPENRTYGANRVYMGFFKPQNGSAWFGNLKKYGIDQYNNVVDTNGTIANYVDINGDGIDDNSGLDLSTVSGTNGAFKATSKSFWSTVTDGSTVELGGTGGLLENIPASTIKTGSPTSTPAAGRKIYTLVGSTRTELNTTTGANAITPAMLGISPITDTDTRNKVVNFIYGQDSYGLGTSVNRSWIMGDVLHSRPLIINYNSYQICDPCTDTNKCICAGATATCTGGVPSCTTGVSNTPTASETTCDSNKNNTMIYVGGNDGMLHAFRDCDGNEVWSFIPPDMLPNLQNIATNTTNFHPYFVDSTPQVYLYNAGNTGTISSTDKVIIMFGERRGGGSTVTTTGSYGSYYVLDVTNRTAPTYLYSISSATTISGSAVFSELGETWSEPKIIKMKIGTADKIVAFFGAGYDNVNEDSRYGNTQSFSGVTPVNNGDTGASGVSATGTALSKRGRGIYAIELATLNNGVPTVNTTPTKIWSYTYGSSSATGNPTTDSSMTFSFPSEISAIDSDGDGYADRLYAADTGGNIWRFDVKNTSVASWTGRIIFSLNPSTGTPGVTDFGRKIFYKPSIVVEPTYTMLFFGTGDREHPKNPNVVDRIYALKDRGQTTAKTESDLYDATADDLQDSSTSASSVITILNTLAADTNYGWFIKLNDTTTPGEKVLASPMVFNKVAYVTTYAPGTSTDVCQGDAGNAFEYALDYKTGEAVLNFNAVNDSTTTTNIRAQSHINGVDGGTGKGGYVLDHSDRRKGIGSGIPSGDVIVINPNGQLEAFTGVGGSIAPDKPKPGGTSVPLYWRQK